MPSIAGQVICVTGASGFIAFWMVKLLLEKGYSVKGTVRNPDDPKNSHLRELEGAKERLTLCKADLLDYQSLREAISGCDGVFHSASPVTDDPLHGKEKVAKDIIEAIDEEKKSITFKVVEGDIMELYKTFKCTVHVDTKGENNLVTWTFDYEKMKEDVPDPNTLMEFLLNITKDIETHHLQN